MAKKTEAHKAPSKKATKGIIDNGQPLGRSFVHTPCVTKKVTFLKKYHKIWTKMNCDKYIEHRDGKYLFSIPFDLDPAHLDIDYEHGECPSELEPFVSGALFTENITQFIEPFSVVFYTTYDDAEFYFYNWDGNELSRATIDYMSRYEELSEQSDKISEEESKDEYSILQNMLNNNSVDARFQPSKDDWRVIYRKAKDGGEASGRALLKAVEDGNIELVKKLIAKRADIEAKNDSGQPVIMRAVICEQKEIVKLLIDGGADINATDNYGYTSLIWASFNGYREIAELLIYGGADVDAKNNDGETALMQAVLCDKKEIVELLVEKGADIEVKNNDGETALTRAAGDKKILKLLTGKGANTAKKDKRG